MLLLPAAVPKLNKSILQSDECQRILWIDRFWFTNWFWSMHTRARLLNQYKHWVYWPTAPKCVYLWKDDQNILAQRAHLQNVNFLFVIFPLQFNRILKCRRFLLPVYTSTNAFSTIIHGIFRCCNFWIDKIVTQQIYQVLWKIVESTRKKNCVQIFKTKKNCHFQRYYSDSTVQSARNQN